MEWTPERIRRLREHIGWRQVQMGEYLGYGTGAQVRVSELERGEVNVSGPISRLLDLLAKQKRFKEGVEL